MTPSHPCIAVLRCIQGPTGSAHKAHPTDTSPAPHVDPRSRRGGSPSPRNAWPSQTDGALLKKADDAAYRSIPLPALTQSETPVPENSKSLPSILAIPNRETQKGLGSYWRRTDYRSEAVPRRGLPPDTPRNSRPPG